jgi:tRNA G18 (ribose-2'-O)-methylase SpoU
MVKIHHYAQNKFQSFEPDKQKKALVEMLSALEGNISDPEFVAKLIPSLLDCYEWSASEVKDDLKALQSLHPDTLPHDIIRLINPVLRYHMSKYDENEPQVTRYDMEVRPHLQKAPFPITVIADNLRSRYNLGAIYRTAECVSARWMYMCGISAFPPVNAFVKSYMGTEERVPYTTVSDTEDAIRYCREDGIPVIALETVTNSRSLFDYQPTKPVAVILGNEALGIEDRILKQADEILHIPIFGWKNSLNVSNAFTLAAYWLSGVIK